MAMVEVFNFESDNIYNTDKPERSPNMATRERIEALNCKVIEGTRCVVDRSVLNDKQTLVLSRKT
jgi:hypothetical protein